jgi:hypothetical protein
MKPFVSSGRPLIQPKPSKTAASNISVKQHNLNRCYHMNGNQSPFAQNRAAV